MEYINNSGLHGHRSISNNIPLIFTSNVEVSEVNLQKVLTKEHISDDNFPEFSTLFIL